MPQVVAYAPDRAHQIVRVLDERAARFVREHFKADVGSAPEAFLDQRRLDPQACSVERIERDMSAIRALEHTRKVFTAVVREPRIGVVPTSLLEASNRPSQP